MKKTFIILLSFIMIISFVGCSGQNGEGDKDTTLEDKNPNGKNQGITFNRLNFERVNYNDLDMKLQSLIDEDRMIRGYSVYEDPTSEYSYIAVFSGEKQTGGYSTKIESIVDNEGITGVTVKEISPKPGEAVTEAITYPMDIVRVTGISGNFNVVNTKGDTFDPIY